MSKLTLCFFLSLLLAIPFARSVLGEEAADPHDDHDHGALPGKAVEVSAEARRLIGLETMEIRPRRVSAVQTLWGRFEPSPDALSLQVAPCAGRVAMQVRTHGRVQKGAPVVLIDSPEWVAASREVAVLEARLETFRTLGRRNAELETQLALARIRRDALQGHAEVQGERLLLRASGVGFVSRLVVPDGGWVEAGAPVLEITDPTLLRFRSRLTAETAARIPVGATARLGEEQGALTLLPADDRGNVDAVVDFQTRSAAWRVGTLWQAEVDLAQESPAAELPAIPERALCRIGLENYLFVQDPEDADRFVALQVETGARADGWVQILNLPHVDAPLRAVVRGHYELRLILPKADAEEEAPAHFHADGQIHRGED